MKNKWLAVGIILLFVGTYIIPAIAQNTEKSRSPSRGNWLYVGGSGPGNYTRINDALFYARDGDTVFVYSGIYYEWIGINYEISLIGEDKYNTIIDDSEENNSTFGHPVITNVADHVTISGFTIQNGHYSGIYLHTRDVPIRKNVEYVTIHDTIIKDNGEHGIDMNFVVNSEFYNNTIINNTENGISIKGDPEQHGGVIGNNIFHNNTITNNPIGINLYVVESGTNIFENNDIRSNEIGVNLFFKYSVDAISIFQSNNIIKNKRAVKSYSSMKLSDVMSNRLLLHPQETWDANYWDAWKTSLPRPICSITRFYLKPPDRISAQINKIIIPITTSQGLLDGGRLDFGVFPSIYFDRHPAQEPYDIGGT
jgi:hypothetical protein